MSISRLLQLKSINSLQSPARRSMSTSGMRRGGAAAAGDEPEYYNRLNSAFYKAMGGFWGFVVVFIAQDRYFTRPDENGVSRLHPITRWILYHRTTEDERIEKVRQLLIEARQEAEVSVFGQLEGARPVKDPRFDPRILHQGQWAYGPSAHDVNYVDLSDVKWRKGYGEDEDSVETLKAKKAAEASK